MWGVSDATRHRASQREHDPFPAGRLIMGKRFWDLQPDGEVMQWLERQNDPPRFNPSLTKAAQADTSHDTDPDQQDLAGIGHGGAPEAPLARVEDATAPPVEALAESAGA